MQGSTVQLQPAEQQRLERNLAIYPWYRLAAGTMPWLPVFFLYFLQFVPLGQVVLLSAIYYLAVVVSEVPSGYLSDRFGRRITLLVSASSLLLAYLLFIFAQNFQWLIVAEIFLAAGIACQSGSDTSLLYDSLVRLRRENEYAEREARAEQFSLAAAAMACLLGGFSGLINLVVPYILSAFAALLTLSLCYRLTEPTLGAERTHDSFVQQLAGCIRYLGVPLLLWLLCIYVAGYCLQHILFEFYQPYLELLGLTVFDAFGSASESQAAGGQQGTRTSAVSGIVVGLSMLLGVLGARLGMPLFRLLGISRLMLLALVMQALAIAVLGAVLHPLVLLLLVARNFSMAMVHGPLMGAIGPLVDGARRATYLSLQSLAARLGFSLWLFALSLLLGGDQALDWEPLSTALKVCAGAGFVCLLLLGLTARRIR